MLSYHCFCQPECLNKIDNLMLQTSTVIICMHNNTVKKDMCWLPLSFCTTPSSCCIILCEIEKIITNYISHIGSSLSTRKTNTLT